MPNDTKFRHPEKRLLEDKPSGRKPPWLRVRVPLGGATNKLTASVMRANKLSTVCEEASCPNIGECWSKKHATFLIMGDICTRACAFCNITTGMPKPLDPLEPLKVAQATNELGLKHVVITSVDRDDLKDGGARHISETVKQVRIMNPDTTVEILTPDFRDKPGAIEILLENPPDVFNHNIEVVPRLYPTVRPGARYFVSLTLLAEAKRYLPSIFTKSGAMVGLGESMQELHQLMDDLRAADVDFLTVGQYLQPTLKHARVERYVPPDEFQQIARLARGKGFSMVSASPLTRSSYHAGEDFERLRKNRAMQSSARAKS